MMSTKGYGLFFHTPFATEWNMGWDSSDYYSFKAFGGDLDYYFMYGPDFYTMIDRYTELTGKSPMLPRFAMGLHVGTYSGGTWKNEEMTSDKYPPALCKRLREEEATFITPFSHHQSTAFGSKKFTTPSIFAPGYRTFPCSRALSNR